MDIIDTNTTIGSKSTKFSEILDTELSNNKLAIEEKINNKKPVKTVAPKLDWLGQQIDFYI